MAQAEDQRRRDVAGYKHGRVPRAVRNNQLLDLAEELLIENGYAGFSIDDLCRAAGVSRPIVYEHFGSKDGIYLACVRRIRSEFELAVLNASAGSHDLATTLERGADAFFSILERDPRRWSLVYGGATALVGPLADQLAELRDATVEQIAVASAPFAPHAEPERVSAWAHAVSGAGEQLGRWWLRNPHIPRERIVSYHRDFLHAAAQYLIASVAAGATTNSHTPNDPQAPPSLADSPPPPNDEG
jgi:AcrR family transcriptional regulator